MNLAVIKPRTYISPSAFGMWQNCVYQFYQYYLAGNPFKERLQTYPAALGSAFDAYIKGYLSQHPSLKGRKDLDVQKMMEKIKVEDDVDKTLVMSIAHEIYKTYIKLKLHEPLMDAKVLDLDREIFNTVDGIPILGQIDAIVDGKPFDWKTRGFNSSASPTPGYNSRISNTGIIMSRYRGDAIMETAKPAWATQLLFYNWCLGIVNYPTGQIHELTKTAQGWNMSNHDVKISDEFADQTLIDLKKLWRTINDLHIDVQTPEPMRFRCEKYNQVCVVAEYCGPYQRSLGNPERREMM